MDFVFVAGNYVTAIASDSVAIYYHKTAHLGKSGSKFLIKTPSLKKISNLKKSLYMGVEHGVANAPPFGPSPTLASTGARETTDVFQQEV